MTLNTFKVHLILKTDKINSKGLTPIFAKIWLNGKNAELSTNRNIHPSNWNHARESAKPVGSDCKELNQFLEVFKSRVYQASKLMLTEEEISLEGLKEAIHGKKEGPLKELIATTIEHNRKFEQRIQLWKL
jgi:hypothetical protein